MDEKPTLDERRGRGTHIGRETWTRNPHLTTDVDEKPTLDERRGRETHTGRETWTRNPHWTRDVDRKPTLDERCGRETHTGRETWTRNPHWRRLAAGLAQNKNSPPRKPISAATAKQSPANGSSRPRLLTTSRPLHDNGETGTERARNPITTRTATSGHSQTLTPQYCSRPSIPAGSRFGLAVRR